MFGGNSVRTTWYSCDVNDDVENLSEVLVVMIMMMSQFGDMLILIGTLTLWLRDTR